MSWLPLTITAGPLAEPVSVEEAKKQCNVVGVDDDGHIAGLVVAARQHVEQYCGVALVTRTVELRCSHWYDLASLDVAPVQNVTSIKYLDTGGVEQTLDPTTYESVLAGLSAEIRPRLGRSFPATRAVSDAIRIVVEAGYGVAAAVPQPIKHAMQLLIGQWYDNRAPIAVGATAAELPNGVAALLANYRRF